MGNWQDELRTHRPHGHARHGLMPAIATSCVACGQHGGRSHAPLTRLRVRGLASAVRVGFLVEAQHSVGRRYNARTESTPTHRSLVWYVTAYVGASNNPAAMYCKLFCTRYSTAGTYGRRRLRDPVRPSGKPLPVRRGVRARVTQLAAPCDARARARGRCTTLEAGERSGALLS